MEGATKNLLVAAGVTVVFVGGGYLLYTYFSKPNNFEEVQKNLNQKAGSDNIVIVPFNNQKNTAQFYNNDRIIIFDNKTKLVVMKGSYSDGGKTIQIDSQYGGKKYTDQSAYTNLEQTIKK